MSIRVSFMRLRGSSEPLISYIITTVSRLLPTMMYMQLSTCLLEVSSVSFCMVRSVKSPVISFLTRRLEERVKSKSLMDLFWIVAATIYA